MYTILAQMRVRGHEVPFEGPVDPTANGPPQHNSGARDVRDLIGACRPQLGPSLARPNLAPHTPEEVPHVTPRLTPQRIYCGIDTHDNTHHAAIITDTGILLEHRQFVTTATGYEELVAWLCLHGDPISVGIEGTSSYGAGISRHLRRHKIKVVEVPRPNRKLRRSVGKSDPIDAEAAARAVLARHQLSEPKHGDGPIEAIRALRVARSSAVKSATASMNAIRSMLVSAPDALRAQLRGHSTTALLDACIALDVDTARLTDPTHATIVALRSLATRTRHAHGSNRTQKAPHQTRRRGSPHNIECLRARTRHRSRTPGHRRRQPRTPEIGIVIRAPLRSSADSRIIGQDKPAQAAPRR